jgi:hypothetical protein
LYIKKQPYIPIMNNKLFDKIIDPFCDFVRDFDTSKLSLDDRATYNKTVGEIHNEETTTKKQIGELQTKLHQLNNKRAKLFLSLAEKYLE